MPWQIVASDIFHVGEQEYLLICDSFSGFYDFIKLERSRSFEVIQTMKSWFAVHGSPEILETDNGPCYSSREFKKFTQDWKFNHRVSSEHKYQL